MNNEKGQGLRHNDGKTRHDLIPYFAQEQYGKVLTVGATDYAERNWEAGMSWTTVIASMKRHVLAIERGEDFDKKSGLNNYSNHIFIVLQVHYNEKYNVYRYKVGSTNGRYESMKKWYEEELEKVSFTFMEGLSEEEIKDNNDFTKEDIKKFYLEK